MMNEANQCNENSTIQTKQRTQSRLVRYGSFVLPKKNYYCEGRHCGTKIGQFGRKMSHMTSAERIRATERNGKIHHHHHVPDDHEESHGMQGVVLSRYNAGQTGNQSHCILGRTEGMNPALLLNRRSSFQSFRQTTLCFPLSTLQHPAFLTFFVYTNSKLQITAALLLVCKDAMKHFFCN